MEALFISMGVVALAEIGDKTQLLALILATRFKRPTPIIWGILLATLINHGLAGAVGIWITTIIPKDILRWAVGILFFCIALWTLIPDKMEKGKISTNNHPNVFWTTFFTFFLAEMGDKTQIATIVLTAHYSAPLFVIIGTTLGILLADVPVVFVGQKFAEKIPTRVVNILAAIILIIMGLLTLFY